MECHLMVAFCQLHVELLFIRLWKCDFSFLYESKMCTCLVHVVQIPCQSSGDSEDWKILIIHKFQNITSSQYAKLSHLAK